MISLLLTRNFVDGRTNTNIIPSSFWATIEIFRDPFLLHRVRSELKTAFDAAAMSRAEFDVDKTSQIAPFYLQSAAKRVGSAFRCT